MRSPIGKILIWSSVAALALTLFLLVPKPTSAATGFGLPCSGGGPDYRSQMQGAYTVRISHFDETGQPIRYSPGWDSIYWAQCIDPSSSGALGQLLTDLNKEIDNGTITKCGSTHLGYDQYGNIALCSDESDSYIRVQNNNWCWSYYNGDYRCPGDSTPVSGSSGGNSGGSTSGSTNTGTTDVTYNDPSVTVPPNEGNGIKAMDGTSANIAYDSLDNQWLVVAADNSQITAKLFDGNNQPFGPTVSLGSGDTPKIAFSPDSKQFLVIWSTGSAVNGQLLNEDGSKVGGSFRLGGGSNITFFPNTQLKYDARNQRFVAVWNQGDNAMLNTVENGKAGGAVTVGRAMANASSGPTVAIDTKDNQYCVTALSGSNITATPIDATSLKAGSSADIADTAMENIGVEYDLGGSDYFASWIDTGGNAMAETLNQCAAPAKTAQTIPISGDTQSGIMTYAENGQVFGILLQQNSSNIVNDLVTLDGQGNSLGDGAQKLFGGGSSSNVPQGLVADADHTFGAVAIQDSTSVQFAGNVGGGASIVDTSAFKPQPTSKIPTNGLPTDIGSLIEAIFGWALDIVGLALFVRFFWAGLLWFTAAGNTGRTSQAKDIMRSAALGAVLLFSSYVILYTINPDLVRSSFTLGGLPASQTAQGGNTQPTSPTGCLLPLPRSQMAAQLQNYESSVLAKHPDLAQKDVSDSLADQEFVTDIIQQAGGNAKIPQACDNSGPIANSVMLRKPGDTNGEICQVLQNGPGSIGDLKTSDCQYETKWSSQVSTSSTQGPLAPSDALQKHPPQTSVISATKKKLESSGTDLSGSCGAFTLIKASVKAMGGSAGLLKKPSGNNCQGYATDIVAYPDGYIYDALGSSGESNTPQWVPDVCGSNGTCPDRYAPVS